MSSVCCVRKPSSPPRIWNVCEEIQPGRKTTSILDLCRALEYASAAIQAAAPDKGKQEAWMDRMRRDLCRRRELPVGSGIVESACKRIVGSRLKGSGRLWSKAVANAVPAAGCGLENRCWPDFLEWRDCSVAAA